MNNISQKKKITVFHGLVNYGTQSGVFARKLRQKGIDARSVTAIDSYNRITDTILKGKPANWVERIYFTLWNRLFLSCCFFKFDIFHFYFGHTLFLRQWDLPFYRVFRKKVVFHYLGIDVQLYQKSIDKYERTNISTYVENGKEHDKKVLRRLANETRYADIQIVCAPYLSEFVPNSIVLPLAIDLNEYRYTPKANYEDEIVIMHAPTSRGNKGTKYIVDAWNQLIAEGYPIRTSLVENVSHAELKEEYRQCDIFVDQLLGGWYGTASVEAMSIGRPTVCFIREEYFEYIDYGNDIPIINAGPDTIYQVLKNLCDERASLLAIGARSRKFVEKTHDSNHLSDILINLYGTLY